MKTLIAVAILAVTTCAAPAADPSPWKDSKDKTSYVLGMLNGKQLKQNEVDLNLELFLKGFKDAYSGEKTLLNETEAQQEFMTWRNEMMSRQTQKRKVEGDKSKKEGETFLAQNKAKAGVQVTASGLQYKTLTQGTGAKPGSNDTVIVHYRGTLIDGKEFDSSYKRGEPMTFQVTRVIRGWTEALLMMPVGSKWQLVIPGDLAYGERGSPPNIPPNASLLFDVELIGIQNPATPK